MRLLLGLLVGLTLAAPSYAVDTCRAQSSATAVNDGSYAEMSCNPTTRALRVEGTVTAAPVGTQDSNTKQVNGVTTSTGAGAVGTGSQRMAVGQDTTTVAGSAPGTTSAPSANVVSTAPLPNSGATAAIAPTVSAAVEGSNVLCAAACNLYGLVVTNGATAGYLLLFNATSAPADGAVTPIECVAMPAVNSTVSLNYSTPARFGTGLTAVFSSTGCFTKTVSATAFFSGKVK